MDWRWWFGFGLIGSGVSGRGLCRVAAFGVGGLHESDILFITISHCAWRHVISWSLATKKRSKESAFNHATLSVHSVQFSFIGAPKARCSPEPRMCETLLLANSYTHTLRPVRSRASTLAEEPTRHHASLQLHVLVGWLFDLRRNFGGTASLIVRPRFEAGWRRGSACVQIRWVVVRG